MSGYTRIPNVIIESMFTEMNATEQAMCLYICRQTFGFQRDSHTVTKADFINAGIGSKPSVYKNWDSETLSKFFEKEGSLWVTKVNLSSKQEVKKVYPKGKESLPQGYQKFTLKGKECLPSTSGLKKKENIKESIKKDIPPTFPEIDSDPLGKQWADEADKRDAVRDNQPLWKMIVSEIKSEGTRLSRFPEFLEKFPEASGDQISLWVETIWKKNRFSEDGTIKPSMGNLINSFDKTPTTGDAAAEKQIIEFFKEEILFSDLPASLRIAYKNSKVSRAGLTNGQLQPAAREVLRHASTTTI
jgi:hypothetical protein